MIGRSYGSALFCFHTYIRVILFCMNPKFNHHHFGIAWLLRLKTPLTLLLILGATIGVYAIGLYGGFIFDDYPNIIYNSRLLIPFEGTGSILQASFSGVASSLGRPIAMLSFWLNYLLGGLNPFQFKSVNLAIHLFVGLNLFFITRYLLQAYKARFSPPTSLRTINQIALTTTALWLLHPINLTGVLYTVQRMNSLAALFTTLGLLMYLVGRLRIDNNKGGWPYLLLSLLIFTPLATLSKENGILLPIFILVGELVLLRCQTPSRINTKRLQLLITLGIVIPAFSVLVYALIHYNGFIHNYSDRPFTLAERILTEARVLWIYLKWILLPIPSDFALHHDDIPISTNILDPITTLVAILGLILLSGLAIAHHARKPLFTFCLAWFLIGHSLESSIIPLDIAYEHRNYLPVYGPLLLLSYGIFTIKPNRHQLLRPLLSIAIIIIFGFITHSRAQTWSNDIRFTLSQVHNHPNSSRANYAAGKLFAERLHTDTGIDNESYEKARTYFRRSADVDKSRVIGLINLILLEQDAGHPVPDSLLQETLLRLRNNSLNITTTQPFHTLVLWAENDKLSLSEGQIRSLFEAVFDNPSASPRLHANLFSLLSSYYFNTLHKYQEAVSLAIAATLEQPNDPTYHLIVADYAITLGNLDVAEQKIDDVTQIDHLSKTHDKIKILRKRIQDIKENHDQL